MGKKRGAKSKPKKGVEVYDSDDERAYKNEKVPDPRSGDYFNDDVDEFHAKRDQIALKKENVNLLPSGWSSDEEVLGFSSEDSDNEEALIAELKRQKDRQQTKDDMASDIEPTDDEDDDADVKNWGKSKSSMYGTDVHKKKIDEYSDSELNDYDLEEESALAIQRRQAQLIDEQEFEEEFAKLSQAAESSKVEQTIGSDLSKLSKKEKWQIIKKASPELLPLIEKYQTTLKNVRECLLPLLDSINKQQLDASVKFINILKEKVHLSLDFCINVSFYFVLKAAREPNIQNHPIIKRLVQFQGLMKRLDIFSGSEFELELKSLLLKMKELKSTVTNEPLVTNLLGSGIALLHQRKRKQDGDVPIKVKKSKVKTNSHDEDNESSESEDDNDKEENDLEVDNDENDQVGDGRRAVTNKILKNRGLTPRRKKENKNPRVKHRMKYRKAKINRRGQIREVRRELTPYSGELSGIRAGVKRGIRLKA